MKKNRKTIIILIGVVIVVVAVAFVCVKSQEKNKNRRTEENKTVESEEEIQNYEIKNGTDQYFADNSDRIIRHYSVDDSLNIKTEVEAKQEFTSRGFEEFDITTDVTMGGELVDEIIISGNAENKYPMYQTYFCTEDENIWLLYIIDDQILANPLFYNLELIEGSVVIVSEHDSVTSYDIDTNCFYETIPLSTTLEVIKVEKIDAVTLETLTFDRIQELREL